MTTKKSFNGRPAKAIKQPWEIIPVILKPGQEKKSSSATIKKEIKNLGKLY